MTTSMIWGIAALLMFGVGSFLTWRVYYRGAGFDSGAGAWFAFLAFLVLATFAAVTAGT